MDIKGLLRVLQVPARETGEVFRTFSVTSGFLCRGEDQEDKKCMDYQVRYFCKEGDYEHTQSHAST